MIGRVLARGRRTAGLVAYLLGPGKANEHTDPHVIDACDEVEVADPELSERGGPGRLARQLDHYRDLFGRDATTGHVYHVTLSNPAEDRTLTDAEWASVARAAVAELGIDDPAGRPLCRWAAIRHGLSAAGNDHMHLVVNVVRADGTVAAPYEDYAQLGRVCTAAETRLGLSKDRTPGRAVHGIPAPSRADAEITARTGQPQALRSRIGEQVRGIAAAATNEAEFVQLATSAGLLIRPRYARGGRSEVVGYSVAERTQVAGRTAPGSDGPVWFGGGRLGRDLTLPALRHTWTDTPTGRDTAVGVWAGTGRTPPVTGPAPDPDRVVVELRAAVDHLTRTDPADPTAWQPPPEVSPGSCPRPPPPQPPGATCTGVSATAPG